MSTIAKIFNLSLRAFCALTVIFLCYEFYYEFNLSDTHSPAVPPPAPISASPPTELPNGPSIKEILDNVKRREDVIFQKEAKIHREELVIKQKEDLLAKLAESVSSRESALAQPTGVPTADSPASEDPYKSLIQYVYFECESARQNLEFFIRHGLHDAADFIFIFNGETDAAELLPNNPKSPWYDEKVSNIRVVKRDNSCYDLGAHAEVLLRVVDKDGEFMTLEPREGDERKNRLLWYNYSRFILMNASVRGPFLPHWSSVCWSEAFWGRITEKVKMVGMSYDCHEGEGHVQSMVWAVDRIGLAALLQPDPVGLGHYCPLDIDQAIHGDLRSTPAIRNAGFEVDVLTALYHSKDAVDVDGDGQVDPGSTGYYVNCADEDPWHENAYRGFNVHPYETIFVKSARQMQEALLGNMTEWADGSGYSSYNACAK